MKPWTTKSSSFKLETPWFRIRADHCIDGKGREISPYYVMETADWVHVVAVDNQGRIVVVRQWRQASGSFVEELPGGVRDAGEEPLETARRELREETGYVSDNWIQVAWVHPDPARVNNRVWTFLARDIRLEHEPELDDTEELDVRLEAFDAVPGLIAAGRFLQSTQIASYYMAREWLRSTSASGSA
ncbi:NUDIX hydrolase [Nibricoccus sp. IMCC34717]|uniref:NUDIX hydrolase n=1 Tax=Nibricoccus sp. IMCC34717 TaxID=3034021 RepID=UPI00384CE9AD